LRQIIKVNTNPEKAMKSLQYRQIEPTSIEGNLIKKIES